MNCLGRLLQLALLAIVVAGLVAVWHFRDRWVGLLPDSWHRSEAPAGLVGRPGKAALQRARDKVDSLNGWRADSVVLTPAEAASLIGAGLEPAFRGRLDSLQVELGDHRLTLAGRLRTDILPTESWGPLGSVVRETEPLVAEGVTRMLESGTLFWEIERLTVRGIPVPEGAIRAMIQNTVGTRQLGLPIALPAGIADVAVRPDRVILRRVAR